MASDPEGRSPNETARRVSASAADPRKTEFFGLGVLDAAVRRLTAKLKAVKKSFK